jgi:uncharacterized protein YuzE
MIVRYFKDTDTAVLEFADRPVEATREIAENVLVDVDATGTVVSMTIEHASERAALPHMRLEEIGVTAV